MDDASLQRFGLALVVVGATFHLQEVAQYPHTGWATFGGLLLVLGVVTTGMPLVSWSPSSPDDRPTEESADEASRDTDD